MEDKPAPSTPVIGSGGGGGFAVIPSRLTADQTEKLKAIEDSNSAGAFVARVVTFLNTKYKFAVDKTDQLYVYQDGRYLEADIGWVRDTILDNLPGSSSAKYSIRARGEIVDQLKAKKPKLWETIPPGKMCVGNGILDFVTGKLSPHHSGWLSTIKLPVRYDPEAECPRWRQFLADVFPEDAVDLGFEVIAGCLTTDAFIQQAIWLVGEGLNGKSTYTTALTDFIGHENACTTSIQALHADMFSAVELFNKLLMLDTDTSLSEMRDISTWKKIVSHDEIRGRRMWGHGFGFRPFAKVVMAGNLPPKVTDTTYGFLRRVVIVPFDGLRNKIDIRDRDEILAELRNPREQSGLLNECLRAWQRMKRNGKFTIPPSVAAAVEEYRCEIDPIKKFFDAKLEQTLDIKDQIEKSEMMEAYEQFAKAHKLSTVTMTGLTQWFKANTKVYLARPREDEGGRSRTYIRVRFKPEEVPEIK